MSNFKSELFIEREPTTCIVIKIPNEITEEFKEYVFEKTGFKIEWDSRAGWCINEYKIPGTLVEPGECLIMHHINHTVSVLDKDELDENYRKM